MRQSNDSLGAFHDDHLVRIFAGNVQRRFAELPAGVVAPREQTAGLGHRQRVVTAACNLIIKLLKKLFKQVNKTIFEVM